MPTTLKAVYEGGTLRLLTPLPLQEGETIEALVIERTPEGQTSSKPDARTPLEIVREIAALSVRHGETETASRDHDQILYGPGGAR